MTWRWSGGPIASGGWGTTGTAAWLGGTGIGEPAEHCARRPTVVNYSPLTPIHARRRANERHAPPANSAILAFLSSLDWIDQSRLLPLDPTRPTSSPHPNRLHFPPQPASPLPPPPLALASVPLLPSVPINPPTILLFHIPRHTPSPKHSNSLSSNTRSLARLTANSQSTTVPLPQASHHLGPSRSRPVRDAYHRCQSRSPVTPNSTLNHVTPPIYS